MFHSHFKVAGAFNRAGTSRQGKSYSMFIMVCLEPILIDGSLVNGSGYQSREIDCDEQVLTQLCNCKFPVDVEAHCYMGYQNKIRISSVKPIFPKSAPKAASAPKAS